MLKEINDRIRRCIAEIRACRLDQKREPFGALLGEMDWTEELMLLLEERSKR